MKKTNKKRTRKPVIAGLTQREINREVAKKKLLEGMDRHNCIIYRACQYAGCTRNHFIDLYRDDPEFKTAIDALTERKIDQMEESLETKVKVDTVANIYWLKCKGRKRGWNERIGIDINPESTLVSNEVIDMAVGMALKAERERFASADAE